MTAASSFLRNFNCIFIDVGHAFVNDPGLPWLRYTVMTFQDGLVLLFDVCPRYITPGVIHGRRTRGDNLTTCRVYSPSRPEIELDLSPFHPLEQHSRMSMDDNVVMWLHVLVSYIPYAKYDVKCVAVCVMRCHCVRYIALLSVHPDSCALDLILPAGSGYGLEDSGYESHDYLIFDTSFGIRNNHPCHNTPGAVILTTSSSPPTRPSLPLASPQPWWSQPLGRCSGKTVIVTGANTGLGKEAVRHFVGLGAAKVIIACRSTSKGEDAKRDIETSTKRTGVIEVWELDLADYASVQAFAKRVQGLERVDAVLENAGISTTQYKFVGGNESTITFKEGQQPQIFDYLNDEKTADMSNRYLVSKLLEVFACRQITQEHSVEQLGCILDFVNPGWCHSELMREMDSAAIDFVKRVMCRTTDEGSRTLVDAAVSHGPEVHGKYLSNQRVTPVAPLVTRKGGAELQKRVWDELAQKLEQIQPGVLQNLVG
nr:short chain dehydrogenase sol3 [Quercus suber]